MRSNRICRTDYTPLIKIIIRIKTQRFACIVGAIRSDIIISKRRPCQIVVIRRSGLWKRDPHWSYNLVAWSAFFYLFSNKKQDRRMSLKSYNIKDLSFRWNRKADYLFKGANIVIKNTGIVAILGRNGSGKTTFLKILAGLKRDYEGEVFLDGRDIRSYGRLDLAKKISFVEQNANYNIPLSVWDIVNLGNYPYSNIYKEDKQLSRRTDDAIKLLELDEISDKPFTNLSGGEKQKTMIARALCQSQNVILLDEPTSSLDINNRVEIMKILEKLSVEKGVLVVIVSHDINLVSKYASSIIYASDKTIYQSDKEEFMTDEKISSVFNIKTYSSVFNGKRIFYF